MGRKQIFQKSIKLAMGSNEKFCLRWNDFESNISVAFREIREEKDFFDCTLSCGSRQIQAHKLILSACSPFFRSILKQNPHQHPLLYLKGVQFTDLQAVLNFMYHGEVNVAQEELNSFLAVAEDLQVKGLTQNNSSSNTKLKADTTPSPPPPTFSKPRPLPKDPEPPAPPKRPCQVVTQPQPVLQASYQHNDDDDILEVLPIVKTEPVAPTISYPATIPTPSVQQHTGGMESMSSMGMQVTNMEESYGEDGYDYGGYEGDGQGYEGMVDGGIVDQNKDGEETMLETEAVRLMVKEAKGWSCNECGYTSKSHGAKTDVKRHIYSKHLPKMHQCHFCRKSFHSAKSYNFHVV